MNRVRQLTALLFRSMALLVLGLVLLFPSHKDLTIVYGPLLLALGLALSLHRRFQTGWSPFESLRAPAYFALLVIGPALLQMALLLLLRPEPMFDGKFVYEEAVALAKTGQMSPLTYYPPAQTGWYALWFKLFGVSPLVAQCSHLPLHALVSLLTYGLARSTVPRHARIAGLAVAWYPGFVGYVLATPYYHYLYTAGVVATAWAWVSAVKCPRNAVVAGLASGFGALAKATQLIAPAQAVLFWLLAPSADGKSTARLARIWKLVLLFVCGMAIVIAPWTFRNWKIFGELVPVCTSGGLVLYSANNEESNGLYSGVPDAASIDSPHAMLAHSRESADRAKRFIRENPGRFLSLAWNKILHTWGGEATFAELINNRGQSLGWAEDLFSAAFFLGWACIVGFWAAVSITALNARLPLSAIELASAIVIGSNAAVYALFEGGDRHHLPMVPLIVVSAFALVNHRAKACDSTPVSA